MYMYVHARVGASEECIERENSGESFKGPDIFISRATGEGEPGKIKPRTADLYARL